MECKITWKVLYNGLLVRSTCMYMSVQSACDSNLRQSMRRYDFKHLELTQSKTLQIEDSV